MKRDQRKVRGNRAKPSPQKPAEKIHRVNIRISLDTLDKLKKIAAEEGIPYQTLAASVIYRYHKGLLIEKKD
jgi:predicted DNA binding CopG/RHH family protein